MYNLKESERVKGLADQIISKKTLLTREDKPIKRLESIIEQNPHENASYYIIDRIFINGLGSIPKYFPEAQKAYLDLALYYLENHPIKVQHDDPILTILNRVAGIGEKLLNAGNLPKNLGSSKIYEQVFGEVLTFYNGNKDNLKLLKNVGEKLSKIYFKLMLPPKSWNDDEMNGKDVSILRDIIKEKGESFSRNPLIVKEVWERIAKEAKEYENAG